MNTTITKLIGLALCVGIMAVVGVVLPGVTDETISMALKMTGIASFMLAVSLAAGTIAGERSSIAETIDWSLPPERKPADYSNITPPDEQERFNIDALTKSLEGGEEVDPKVLRMIDFNKDLADA